MSNNSKTRGMRVNAVPESGNRGMRVNAAPVIGNRGMRVNAAPRAAASEPWRMSGVTEREYARARGFVVNNNGSNSGTRGMRVTGNNGVRVPSNRGMRVNAAPRFSSIVGNKFDPWLKSQIKSNENLIAQMPIKPRVNLKTRNNASAFVNSARARGGLELYKKFGGYYINAHGLCVVGTGKFIVPKDKAILYIAKSGELLTDSPGALMEEGNTMSAVEKKLLVNSGRISAFIQGSSNVRGLKYGRRDMTLFLPGEEVFDQYVHLTADETPFNRNSNFNKLSINPIKIGPSFGHIFKLPLGPNFSSHKPFNFNTNKNKILWNIPGMLSNRTVGIANSARYERRREMWKVSNILKNGPPGVYIVGTCREHINQNNLSKMTKTVNSTLRGMRVSAENSSAKYFKAVKKANITDPTRGLLQTRNNSMV